MKPATFWRSPHFASSGTRWSSLPSAIGSDFSQPQPLPKKLSGGSYATANFAIAGVFIARLLPAVFLGPIAGVIADRFDRRKLMVFLRRYSRRTLYLDPDC
jgi:MFS family permease